MLNASLDAHIGGSFEITFANADKTEFTCGGTYTEIEIHHKLAFTWMWKNNPNVVEFVTIKFQEEAGGTLMDFEIGNIDPRFGTQL